MGFDPVSNPATIPLYLQAANEGSKLIQNLQEPGSSNKKGDQGIGQLSTGISDTSDLWKTFMDLSAMNKGGTKIGTNSTLKF